jgi:hypothetical protein
MLDRERLTVHRVSQQDVRVPGHVEVQASLEARDSVSSRHDSAVRAAEQNFANDWLDSGKVEHLHQPNAGPFGDAHRAQTPLLAVGRRIKE